MNMVIVSHERAAMIELADRLIMLEREVCGVIAEGRPIELLQSSSNERVREARHGFDTRSA